MTQVWWQNDCLAINEKVKTEAQERQGMLTKPPGSLGRLEDVAITLASLYGDDKPEIKQPLITIFAGDHGVVAQGVSAFPQAVTVEMIRNFVSGGAAISVLAESNNAELKVINCGTAFEIDFADDYDALLDKQVAPGTADLSVESAMSAEQLEQAFIESQTDDAFLTEFNDLLTKYAGRPTPLTCCRNIVKNPLAKIYLKREDLLHGGAHKTNQVLGQALLAKRMGKTEVIAETGAGQHGVATAIACSLLGLKCKVYMGAVDCQRQQPNVFRMKLMGAEVIPVTAGSGTLKDAVNEALRDWSANYENAHYLLGTAAGPHPFPTIVREFQKMIGEEAKAQFFEEEGRLPDYVIAAVGGGSNAIGMFNDFIEHEEVKLIGVEAGGKGIDTDKHGATLVAGTKGMLHGNYTYIMQDKYGQIQESYSISAGLDVRYSSYSLIIS